MHKVHCKRTVCHWASNEYRDLSPCCKLCCVLHRWLFEKGHSHGSNSQAVLLNSFSEIGLQIAVLTESPC